MRALAGARLTSPARLILIFALLGPWGAAACGPSVPGAELPIETLVVGNARITAELAATRADRAKGLMFREELPEEHGMLFLYPDEHLLRFWMKNTPRPLSIAFADAGGRIVHIADLEPFSEQIVTSRRPARYALEMNRGWFQRNGVFEGDVIARIPRIGVE